MLSRQQGKCEKSQQIDHFEKKIQSLSNLSENCLLVTRITNLNRIHEKLFKLSRQQGQIIDVKCEKSQ